MCSGFFQDATRTQSIEPESVWTSHTECCQLCSQRKEWGCQLQVKSKSCFETLASHTNSHHLLSLSFFEDLLGQRCTQTLNTYENSDSRNFSRSSRRRWRPRSSSRTWIKSRQRSLRHLVNGDPLEVKVWRGTSMEATWNFYSIQLQ